jgi:hypothetical protein
VGKKVRQKLENVRTTKIRKERKKERKARK